MTDLDDIKELFRAEMGVFHAEIRALREDIHEVKETVKGFRSYCDVKHGDLAKQVSELEKNHAAINRERKLVFAGLAIAVTGAVKGFFEWILK